MHARAQRRDTTEAGEAKPPAAPRQDWTVIPEAAAILADCAARPPAMRMTEIVDLSTRHVPLYVGRRIGRLNAIHRAEARRILALCDAARDYAAFDAHVRRSVQNAIADTLLHAALARSAACDARVLKVVS
jgi:hypothetical protein